MQCIPLDYIQLFLLKNMNNVESRYVHLIPKKNLNTVMDGIGICCDCGGTDTTILTYGVYCQTCRKFRDFIKKSTDLYQPTGTTLDLD